MNRATLLVPLAFLATACVVQGAQPPVQAGSGLQDDAGTISVNPNDVPYVMGCSPNQVVAKGDNGWECVTLAGPTALQAGDGISVESNTVSFNAATVPSTDVWNGTVPYAQVTGAPQIPTCAAGQLLANTGDGGWQCVTLGPGLAIGDGGVIGLEASDCAVGQIPTWTGTAWTCTNAPMSPPPPSSPCAANQYATWTGMTWTCATLPMTPSLPASACGADQFATWNGTAWSCTSLPSDLTALPGEVSTLQSQMAAANTSIGTLNTEATNATTSINTLNSQVSSANTSINTLNSEASSATTSINALNSQMSSANTSINTLNSQVGTLNSEASSASSSIDTLNSQVAALQGASGAATTPGEVIYASFAAVPASPKDGARIYVSANLCHYVYNGTASRWEILSCDFYPDWNELTTTVLSFSSPTGSSPELVSFQLTDGAATRDYLYGADYTGNTAGTNFMLEPGSVTADDAAAPSRVHGRWQRCGYTVGGQSVCLPYIGMLRDTAGNVFETGWYRAGDKTWIGGAATGTFSEGTTVDQDISLGYFTTPAATSCYETVYGSYISENFNASPIGSSVFSGCTSMYAGLVCEVPMVLGNLRGFHLYHAAVPGSSASFRYIAQWCKESR